jgi:hypothetical protein
MGAGRVKSHGDLECQGLKRPRANGQKQIAWFDLILSNRATRVLCRRYCSNTILRLAIQCGYAFSKIATELLHSA